MAKISNYNAVLEELVSMMMEHDRDHTPYQEDVYLYIEDGEGSLYLFANVGGNSWLDDDHITVMQLREDLTDWSDFVPNLGDIATVLGWSVVSLKERAAAWHCESGWQYDACDMDYHDIRNFIEANPVLMNQITEAENDYIEDSRSEYAERARMALDAALDDEEAEN